MSAWSLILVSVPLEPNCLFSMGVAVARAANRTVAIKLKLCMLMFEEK